MKPTTETKQYAKAILCIVFFIVIVVAMSTVKVLFFSPVDFEYKRLQKNEAFQAFEQQFPNLQKQKIGFDRYTVEYHAQSKDAQIVLAKNYYGVTYFYCNGLQTDQTESVKIVSPEEFKLLIQQDAICTPGVYQAWEIK